MISDAISPATFASTEATHPANPQLIALSSDYAMALEDDGQDEHDSAIVRGGPNGSQSLDDARAEYISKGGTPQPHLPPAEPI